MQFLIYPAPPKISTLSGPLDCRLFQLAGSASSWLLPSHEIGQEQIMRQAIIGQRHDHLYAHLPKISTISAIDGSNYPFH